jgi:hypothetical protein
LAATPSLNHKHFTPVELYEHYVESVVYELHAPTAKQAVPAEFAVQSVLYD